MEQDITSTTTTTRPYSVRASLVPRVGMADLHIHSTYSDSCHTIEEVLDFVNSRTDLDVIAITDHDTISGAVEARRIAASRGYEFDIIVGEEITTRDGHILGLFLSERIPPGLSVSETLALIRAQGGIAVAAHPFYTSKVKSRKYITANGVGREHLMNETFDAIETINVTPSFESNNVETQRLNHHLRRPELGGSDAHIKEAIGKGYTFFPGNTAVELKQAILNNETVALREKWRFNELVKYSRFFIIYFFLGYIKLLIADIMNTTSPKPAAESEAEGADAG